MLRKSIAAIMAVLFTGQFGCYNTFNVSLSELGKAQEGGRSAVVTVVTRDCQSAQIPEGAALRVTYIEAGAAAPAEKSITAYGFTLDDETLSGDDYMIPRGDIRAVQLEKAGIEAAEQPKIALNELLALQKGKTAGAAIPVGCTEVNVTEDAKIGVTDKGGTYHPVSPFNFTLTRNQLVAPDEDLLLNRAEIETGNVKVVSGTRTTLLVTSGFAAVLGAALYVVFTAPEPKEFGQ